jgi:hypothetical protein
MDKSVGKFRPGRRTFLRGVTAAGGVATITCIADVTLADSEPATKQPIDETSKGYKVTQHIQEYYRKARF